MAFFAVFDYYRTYILVQSMKLFIRLERNSNHTNSSDVAIQFVYVTPNMEINHFLLKVLVSKSYPMVHYIQLILIFMPMLEE